MEAKQDKQGAKWETPEAMPLGDLAEADADEEKCHRCTSGSSAGMICGNGQRAFVRQCKDGNQPPSQSCSSGTLGQ